MVGVSQLDLVTINAHAKFDQNTVCFKSYGNLRTN